MKPSSIIIIFLATILSVYNVSSARMSLEESCIRRNLERSLAPKPSDDLEKPKDDYLADKICRDVGRIAMLYVRLKGKLPPDYFKALCNVFGDDEAKLKAYVVNSWLGNLDLIDGYSCASVQRVGAKLKENQN